MAVFELGTIEVSMAHRLSHREAMRRAEEMAEDLKRGSLRDHGLRYSRRGDDRIRFRARKGETDVSGEARGSDRSVDVTVRGTVEIGGLKGVLASEGQVRRTVRDELRKGLRDALGETRRRSATDRPGRTTGATRHGVDRSPSST